MFGYLPTVIMLIIGNVAVKVEKFIVGIMRRITQRSTPFPNMRMQETSK